MSHIDYEGRWYNYSEAAYLPTIYLEHCPRGEAVITGHLRLSSMR